MPLYNVAMTQLEILIPFGLPPAEHAKDLISTLTSECGKDGLAMLLSRYNSLMCKRFDDFSPQQPYEIWLSKWLNKQPNAQHYTFLQQRAYSLNVNLNPGHWFIVNPIHLHIAQNHLVLTDYRQLNLSEQDSSQLFEKAKGLCNEINVELVYGNAANWFLRADKWADFITSTPDAACGHNIEIWSAKGTQELAWRKLQNEIQMEWFIHPVQQQREERGEKVVNGLWMWAGTTLSDGIKTTSLTQMKKVIITSRTETFSVHHSSDLLLSDQLSSAALANDWGSWVALMIELEHNWFKPLCAKLKTREINQLQLHLSNSNTLLSIQTSSNAMRKFWRASNFKNLTT